LNPRSLRLRLFVAATIAVGAALLLCGVLLTQLFERHVTRHYDAELLSYLRQLVSAVEFSPDGKVLLARQLQDARFEEPLSGLYWQIEEDKSGFILSSRSLWDTHIPLPKDVVPAGQIDHHVLPGPQGAPVRVQERVIIFDLPSGSRTLRIAAAMSQSEITQASQAFAADLWPAILVLGLILLAATWFYIGIGLKPLETIRRSLSAVRAGATRRLEGEFPSEVQPLVEEANALLAAQDESLAKARARAADLAHGLKTPLAVLQSDAEKLRARGGQDDIAEEMGQLAGQMRRHVERELAKARLRGTAPLQATPLLPTIERLVASLRRMPRGEALTWDVHVPPHLTAAADAEDLTELLGNLLDNAGKWARHEIRIVGENAGPSSRIHVLDDGPGVPDAALAALPERGTRLDESVPGTGLGLAIAYDIAAACHGSLQVANRPGGGFSAVIELPAQASHLRHA
jgi:signal transduction histidine kinase